MGGCEPWAGEAIEKTATAMASAGAEVDLLELPAEYADLPELQYEIQRFETARSYAHEYETAADRLDWRVRKTVEKGMKIGGDRYIERTKRDQQGRQELSSQMGDADASMTNS